MRYLVLLCALTLLAQKPVGTMKDLMWKIIYPTSNAVFYVGHKPQKSEKDWQELQNNALTLAESANLLMASDRAHDQGRWMQDAELLRVAGEKAFKAATAHDLPALEALNDELYEACQSCHEHYRPGYKRKP